MNRPQLVTLSGDERSWTLILADKAERPSQPLSVVRNSADPKHANVTVALAKPGQRIVFDVPLLVERRASKQLSGHSHVAVPSIEQAIL